MGIKSWDNPFSLTIGLFFMVKMLLAQNIAPVAVDDSYTLGFNVMLQPNTTNGVLANDNDANGIGTLNVRTMPLAPPSNGTLALNVDGSFTYTPNTGFIGTDSFTYRVCDDGTPNTVVSRFDFDTPTITDATIGPNATSVNSNAAQTGCGIHFPTGAGGSTGFDIVVPNTSGIFDFTSFSVAFEYQDQEGTADIVTAGNFRIYHISGNTMGIQLTVIRGDTGVQQIYTQTLGNFLSGNVPYTVAYDEATGNVTYIANGTTTVFSVAPPYSPLDTASASNIVLGEKMDGAGSSLPSLCSMEFVDTSLLCDDALVTLNITASIITNRGITYRVTAN
ncbi:MAG: Ig-like domain-containing protein [Bacteroidota bacterium]